MSRSEEVGERVTFTVTVTPWAGGARPDADAIRQALTAGRDLFADFPDTAQVLVEEDDRLAAEDVASFDHEDDEDGYCLHVATDEGKTYAFRFRSVEVAQQLVDAARDPADWVRAERARTPA